LFTGLYPRHHGVVHRRAKFGDLPSFVQTLRANDYQTVGFADGGYMSADFGYSRGFEVYDEFRDVESDLAPMALPRGGKRNADTTRGIFDRARAFLQGRRSERPLFLFAHTYAVHDYFNNSQSKENLHCLLGFTTCTEEKWEELESLYESGIDDFDRELGSFLELVEQTLGLDNTLIILLSDHGEGFDHERNRIHHAGRLHRDQLQVPLLVAGPGIVPGGSEELVSLVDIRPSLLELVGLSDDTEHDGRSFVGHLDLGALARLRSFLGRLGASPTEESRDAVIASDHNYYWQAGRRKKVSRPSEKPTTSARIDTEFWHIEDRNGEELYHVSDRRQEKSQVVERRAREERDASPRKPVSQPTELELSEELIEQLKALGYVE
jgi:arylsulfatase A-like enzyme